MLFCYIILHFYKYLYFISFCYIIYDFLLCRWHEFRTLCDSQRRINVVLELSTNLPDEEVLERWLAEPIKCVMVSTNLFLTNKRGYPVLSKPHQSFLKKLFKVHKLFIIYVLHYTNLSMWKGKKYWKLFFHLSFCPSFVGHNLT